MHPWLASIAVRYWALLNEHALRLVVLFGLGLLVAALSRVLRLRIGDERWRRAALGVLAVALLGGLFLAVSRAALFDDAFICFRYARNLAEGNGLVFNLGERVEGYTNFLWTVLIGAVMWLSPFDAPDIALVGGLLTFVANLIVVYRLARVLRDPVEAGGSVDLPFATLLLALQTTFVSYGTSGLETEFACVWVTLGALVLIRAARPGDVARAALCFALGALSRPDHVLFAGVGSLLVLWVWGGAAWRARSLGRSALWRTGGAHLLAWAAPFSLCVAYAVWKLWYYGDLLPNTYYAKSADLIRIPQGLIYAEAFYLGSHTWLWVLLFALGAMLPARTEAQRRFRMLSVGGVLVHNAYVIKVGGGFMYGRFFVSVLPLLACGAERAVCRLLSSETRRVGALGVVAAGALLASAGGVPIVPPNRVVWHLTDESSYYRLERFFPAEVEHVNFDVGRELGKLHAAGVSPLVATSGIGMLGYNSRLPILDRLGLVDPVVAHLPLKRRRRPGHEKSAPAWYIEERNPHFIRVGRATRFFRARDAALATISFGPKTPRMWQIYHYDAPLMRRVRELLPRASFVDFERHLDSYIAKARRGRITRRRVERDLVFFKRYYFDHNRDPARLKALEKLVRRRRRR